MTTQTRPASTLPTQTRPYTSRASKGAATGCGCSGNCGGGNCQCSTSCDATCGCNEGLLVQPHFFAGQLLTDDDLQALTNYVVTKHRLHNRFVVGSGVSCGLALTCHPCGQGKVIVQPGYAIDCCGNDIWVPCSVELDINAMVRDLKFKQLGHDCGDPCAKDPKNGQEKTRKDCDEPTDRYCLYLRYCEQPTDPIAPYNQDESCNTTCQPSRLREGYNFELRCPEEEDCPPSVLDRIRCCIGDLEEAEKQSGDFERSQLHLQRTSQGLQAIKEGKKAKFTEEDINLVFNVKNFLKEDEPLFLENAEVESGDTELGDKIQPTEEVFRRSLDNVQTLGAAIARWELLTKDEKNIFEKSHSEIVEGIKESRDLLTNVAPKIGKLGPLYLTSPIELAAADATVANTKLYINPKLDIKQRQTSEATLYAYNSASNQALNSQLNQTLTNFKNWLLRKMYKCPPTTECCLIEEVTSVVISTGDTIDETTIAAYDTLVRAFIRYLLDCICSALIPPCPTCEDPAVKLACLEVKDCKVDNICNLERTFLLTEHNLRYWLPFLHGFGEALERICCEFSKKFDKPILDPRQGRFIKREQAQLTGQADLFVSGKKVSKTLAALPVFSNILRIAGISEETFQSRVNLGQDLTNIVTRQPQIAGLFEQAKVEAATDIGGFALTQVLEQPQAKAALRVAAKTQLKTIETRLESLSANSLRAAEEMQERISVRVRGVEEDLDNRLTTSKLEATTVIKDLQSKLTELEKTNDKLLGRLTKLEKDGKK